MQTDIADRVLELIRRTSTDLPSDVEARLRAAAAEEEPGSAARSAIETIVRNVELSRRNGTPICQDTGTPIFRVRHPAGWSTKTIRDQLRSALARATKLSYMRPNAVDPLSERNSGDNLGGEHFPTVHFEEGEGEELVVDLMLKGGGCENVGAQYPPARREHRRGPRLRRGPASGPRRRAEGPGPGLRPRNPRGGHRRRPRNGLCRLEGRTLRADRGAQRGSTPRRPRAASHRGGESPSNRSDGLRGQDDPARREDRESPPPPGELFRDRILYVLGLPTKALDPGRRPRRVRLS